MPSHGSLDNSARANNLLINSCAASATLANVDSEIEDVQQRVEPEGGPAVRHRLFGQPRQKVEAELNRLMQERSRILTQMGQQQDASGNKQRSRPKRRRRRTDLEAEIHEAEGAGRPDESEEPAAADVQRSAPGSSEAVPQRVEAELQQQYALTKQAQQQAQFAKQNAAEAERAANAAERERKEREKNARDPQFQSAALLKEFEGFTSKAKFDRNAFRAGFGSDTTTREDGSIQR
jgi:hypothetical protein